MKELLLEHIDAEEMEDIDTEHLEAALEIVRGLPTGPYAKHYQATYADPAALVVQLAEIRARGPLADPRVTDDLQDRLTAIAVDPSIAAADISGRCAMFVPGRLTIGHIDTLVNEEQERRLIVRNRLGYDAIGMKRGPLQVIKPRSNEYDGDVVSYMGDGYNGYAKADRTPDPRRMQRALDQAVAWESAVANRTGIPMLTAHEGLHLGLEQAMMHVDEQTGKTYAGSGNVVWIGDRTNDPDSPHVQMLKGVMNPIGVKLGYSTTPEKIQRLEAELNPEGLPGKILWMIRVGDDETAIRGIAGALRRHAPNGVNLYDEHGSTTKTATGKVRATTVVANHIGRLAEGLDRYGNLPLHGVHLEVEMNGARHECVDTPDQTPQDTSIVDPGLHPVQYNWVLGEVAQYMPGAKAA